MIGAMTMTPGLAILIFVVLCICFASFYGQGDISKDEKRKR
jgi:hypothetical protein